MRRVCGVRGVGRNFSSDPTDPPPPTYAPGRVCGVCAAWGVRVFGSSKGQGGGGDGVGDGDGGGGDGEDGGGGWGGWGGGGGGAG